MKFQRSKIIWGVLGVFATLLVVSAFRFNAFNPEQQPPGEDPVPLFQMPILAQTVSSNGIYMTINGQNQGQIQGSSTNKGKEEAILVFALQHEVEIPSDTRTGLPSGQRGHKPLSVTKLIDQASPLLYQALLTEERLDVTLKFYRDNEMGEEEQYYTIRLENAIIVNIRADVPDIRDPENDIYGHQEHISFTYAKIVWNYEANGIETEDDWNIPTR
jgi:type VI secretion system secreted protein Hcp